jgi:hypothetical protein
VSESSGAQTPLAVDVDLDVAVDGWPVSVRSATERVFVDLPTLRAAAAAFGSAPRGRLPRLDAALRAADLTVEVRVRGYPVGVLGADARSGVLARQAGVAPAEIRVGGALAAVGRTAVAVGRAVAAVFQ